VGLATTTAAITYGITKISTGEGIPLAFPSTASSADFGQAASICKEYVVDAFGDQLISASVDSRSSYTSDREHKIFIHSQVDEGSQGIVTRIQSICWVSILDSKLKQYRQYSAGEE